MSFFLLALKRRLRSAGFVLMLLLLALCVFAAAAVGGRVEMSPCALVDEDGSDLSQKVCDELTENNFVMCPDREELYRAVSMGKFDCGVVIKAGFAEGVENCDLTDSAVMVTSPVSILGEVYKAHAMGSMYRLMAPGLSYSVIRDQGLDLSYEAVEREFVDYLAGGDRFTFDVKSARGASLENIYGEKLMQAAMALLGFALLYPSARSAVRESLRRSAAIGGEKAARAVLIPDLAAQLLCCLAAGVIGLMTAERA
ncbi:MAG: hypothetical protein IJG63_08725 [Oscillospiraceae bacterium]|nr:hypothetical protein [Oscillospiraceae bacterium]